MSSKKNNSQNAKNGMTSQNKKGSTSASNQQSSNCTKDCND